jgi:hypothetical protein
VGVAVDQSRQDDLPARVEVFDGGEAGHLRRACHRLDEPVPYDDRGVLLEADALLLVMDEDGTAGDQQIGGGTGGRVAHSPNVRRRPRPA